MRDEATRLLRFEDVVDDLLLSFSSPGDVPAGHRCSERCTHRRFPSRASLLSRLQELIEPGSSLVPPGDKDRRATRRPGSPAPWASAPAELLDEILLGALAFDVEIRKLLDEPELLVKRTVVRRAIAASWHPPLTLVYEPTWVPLSVPASSVPRHEAGAAALAGLPKLLPRLQHHLPEHPLANGGLLNPKEPRRGRRRGKVETTVRSWHRRARMLTGHEVDERIVVHRLPNPHAGADRRSGPICEAPGECGHASCWPILLTRLGRHLPLRCPHCRTIGLVEDSETGALFCDRPSCRNAEGARHEWSLDAIDQMLYPDQEDPE